MVIRVEEVFQRNAKVASQEIWTKAGDMTPAQSALPIVACWLVKEIRPNGEARAVDLIGGLLCDVTAAVVVKQGLEVGDRTEVREGRFRIDDAVILYKR